MSYIRNITFKHVWKNEGEICDQCGAYIVNVYTITYSDGLKMRYGIECFKKLFAAGNLTEKGMALMKKALKKIKEAYEFRDGWLEVNSIEEAEEKGLPDTDVFRTYEVWKRHSFDEFKEYCTNENEGYFFLRLNRAKKLLERFKNVNFDLSKIMEKSHVDRKTNY